jgi:hypothetical protein
MLSPNAAFAANEIWRSKMKTRILVVLAIVASVLALNSSANAQGQKQWTTNVPFAFQAGDVTLAPGKYTIRVVNPSSDRTALQLRSEDGRSVAIVQAAAVSGKKRENAMVVFNRYGDRYFFSAIKLAGEEGNLAATRSKDERMLQREIAGHARPEVLVALKAR